MRLRTELARSNEPGAIRISCFFVRRRKKTSSLVGSISRMVERALSVRDLINAAYCWVTEASKFERIGMPEMNSTNDSLQSECNQWQVNEPTIIVNYHATLNTLVFLNSFQWIIHFCLEERERTSMMACWTAKKEPESCRSRKEDEEKNDLNKHNQYNDEHVKKRLSERFELFRS